MGRPGGRGPQALATGSLVLLLLAGTATTASAATKIGEWKLKGNFRNAAGTNVKLGAIGLPEFQTTNVNGTVRKALVFDEAEGVKLTRVPRSARSTYSILIYFEFDEVNGYRRVMDWGSGLDDPSLYVNSGYLSLYSFAETPIALVEPDRWYRLLVTRDGGTGLMRFYLNGRLRLAYVDLTGEGRMTDGTANIFKDNAGEESSGTLANVQLWRGVVTP